jgi:hypothetical protein
MIGSHVTRSMKTARRRIGVTWTGETIEFPEAKSFNEQIIIFAAALGKPIEMEELIFMTPTGLEVNEESYLDLQATSDIFYVYDVTQIAEDGPIPYIFDSVPEMSSKIIAELPSGASANLNMDDQIKILESRLLVAVENLKVHLSMCLTIESPRSSNSVKGKGHGNNQGASSARVGCISGTFKCRKIPRKGHQRLFSSN